MFFIRRWCLEQKIKCPTYICHFTELRVFPSAPGLLDTFGNNFLNVFFNKGGVSTFIVVIGTGVGFIAGLIFNYIFSLLFVYRVYDKNAKSRKGFILFLLFSLIGLIIQTLGVYIGYGLLNINEWIVKIIFVVIVLVFNYFTRKKYIFKNTESTER